MIQQQRRVSESLNNELGESLLDFFCVRRESYRFLSLFFAREPESDFLKFIIDSESDLKKLFSTNEKCLNLLVDLVEEAKTILASQSKKKSEGLQQDFLNLFVGPSGPYAPPWESVYTSDEKLLFEKSTFDVREEHKKFGLDKEPDDHIAAELQFLAYLSDFVISQLQKRDIKFSDKAVREQSEFMENHLLRWVYNFCESVDKYAIYKYFKIVSNLLKEFIKSDAKEIKKLVNNIYDAT